MSIMGGYAAARADAIENVSLEREDAKQAKRTALFAVVENPRDWRDPIHQFISADVWRALRLTTTDLTDAVEHFTATTPSFTAITHEGLFCGYVVQADGYRRGPAGDH